MEEHFLPSVRGKLTVPSLTVTEGEKRNAELVPYVTRRISVAGAASVCASVPFYSASCRGKVTWKLLFSVRNITSPETW